MRTIETGFLFECTEMVFIYKPSQPSENSQYVVMLSSETASNFMVVNGPEQFRALTFCLSEAGLHMSGRFERMLKGGRRSRRRSPTPKRVKSPAFPERFVEGNLGVQVNALVDDQKRKMYEIVLQRQPGGGDDEDSSGPWTDASERMPLSERELQTFGEIFWHLDCAEYKPAFMSSIDEWFLPPQLARSLADVGHIDAGLLRQAASHIREKCNKLAFEWIEYLECLREPSAGTPVNKVSAERNGNALVPWIEPLPKSEKDKYEIEIGMFYTAGKDFAFEWIAKNPRTTKPELIALLLKDQSALPIHLARETAEQVADRVFYVNGKQ